MTLTNELIEAARRYWQDTLDLNPDAAVLTVMREFLEDRPEDNLTNSEVSALAFEILTTKGDNNV